MGLLNNENVDEVLIDSLVVSGNEEQVASRLIELQMSGLDELLVLPIGPGEPKPWIERGLAAVARAVEQLR